MQISDGRMDQEDFKKVFVELMMKFIGDGVDKEKLRKESELEAEKVWFDLIN